MKSSIGPRRQWLLGERKLLIGRGRDCDLVVFDPLVSRRHCELWIDKNRVKFTDLGSSNATQVNGRVQSNGELLVGDELTVGDHTFVLELTTQAPPSSAPQEEAFTPKTVSIEDTPYFARRAHDSPSSAETLFFKLLIQTARKFSEARSVSELCGQLLEVVRNEFDPEHCWIGLFVGENGDATIRAESEAAGRPYPVKAFHQVWRQRRALSISAHDKGNGDGHELLIAPMIGVSGIFGVVAVINPSSEATEHAFHFFVALTHAFAPFYQSLERNEQFSRDFERGASATEITSTLVGNSEEAQQLRECITRVAPSNLNVLLLGETGTGKELVSRLIHNMSARSDRPYVVVNCPSIPGELFESMMFGHRRGSFTGAHENREGYFSEAQGGTLFLDEIGDLPLEYQTRLLRAVELHTYRPVGANQDQYADVRIIAATNQIPDGTGTNTTLRADFYHRLAGFEITLSPLRQRQTDIADLAGYFLAELRAEGRTRVRGFTPEAMKRLESWTWPGNVRELKLCVERAVVLCKNDSIGINDIVLWATGASGDQCPPVSCTLEEVEQWHVGRVFKLHGGNITATAQVLGISRSTAYDKLRQFGIKG